MKRLQTVSVLIASWLLSIALGAILLPGASAEQLSPQKTGSGNAGSSSNFVCAEVFAGALTITDKSRLLEQLSTIDIRKDKFETTSVYEERISQQLATLGLNTQDMILIEWPLDPEYIRYDADRNHLVIKEFAISNLSPDAQSLFSYGSRLHDAGINVDHSAVNDYNIALTFQHTEVLGETYVGENAFGAKAAIQRVSHSVAGVFEREGKDKEIVWGYTPDRSWSTEIKREDLGTDVFSLDAPPALAKRIDEGGMVVLGMTLRYPFYADGAEEFPGNMNTGEQHSYTYRCIIADMRCMALRTPEDGVIAVRKLQ